MSSFVLGLGSAFVVSMPLVFSPVSLNAACPKTLEPLAADLREIALKHSQDRSSKIPVVGIAGCPGVGKTVMADFLRDRLAEQGISCVVIRFDDWTNTDEMHKKTGHYYNLQGVHNFFDAIAKGERNPTKPVVNEFTDEHFEEELCLEGVDLILFEGLFALTAQWGPMNYYRHCDHGIFVEADKQDIWKWKHDRPRSTPRTEEEFKEHMDVIFGCYDRFIAPYKSNASWVVKKFSDHSYECTTTKK